MTRTLTIADARVYYGDRLHEVRPGRYLVANWLPHQGQYTARTSPAPWQGYQYSCARSVDALAGMVGTMSRGVLLRRLRDAIEDDRISAYNEAYYAQRDAAI